VIVALVSEAGVYCTQARRREDHNRASESGAICGPRARRQHCDRDSDCTRPGPGRCQGVSRRGRAPRGWRQLPRRRRALPRPPANAASRGRWPRAEGSKAKERHPDDGPPFKFALCSASRRPSAATVTRAEPTVTPTDGRGARAGGSPGAGGTGRASPGQGSPRGSSLSSA
jgi:hypothetical protein